MSPDERIEVLRQAWRELEFECSSTADDLGDLIFELAKEWGVEIKPSWTDNLVDGDVDG
jgi:hypothetical protein